MNAIPTLYGGIRFRSRLEAMWAAFFDLCRWPWTYEPMDLDGYIPDFVLRFPHQPVLAEVKPAIIEADADDAKAIIEKSGWKRDALILGIDLFDAKYCTDGILVGWLGEYWADNSEGFCWGGGAIGSCLRKGGKHIGLCHDVQSYRCRYCGEHEGNVLTDDASALRSLMAKARNKTQWNYR